MEDLNEKKNCKENFTSLPNEDGALTQKNSAIEIEENKSRVEEGGCSCNDKGRNIESYNGKGFNVESGNGGNGKGQNAYGSNKDAKAKSTVKNTVKSLPNRSILEEVGNAVTHGVGAVLACVGLALNLIYSNTFGEVFSAIIYGVCTFVLMLNSCLYHSFKRQSKVKRLWRRFDYLSIYLLIGGTFAPIFWVYMANTLGMVLFSLQWAVIITGVTLTAVFGPERIRKLNLILYFLVGWSGIIFIPQWIPSQLGLLFFILGGGIVYSLGMIPFVLKRKGSHFIWHFFALAGAVIQWIGIYEYIFKVF